MIKYQRINIFYFKTRTKLKIGLKRQMILVSLQLIPKLHLLDAHQADLVGISMCYKTGFSGYIPLAHKTGKNLDTEKY